MLRLNLHPWLTAVWSRWHKEIFADLVALCLGGPASALGMKDFLAYPASKVLSFCPLSVHPAGWIRSFLMAEMIERMGFSKEAGQLRSVWRALYGPHLRRARMPRLLLDTAARVVPEVIDELAFQPRCGLAQLALVDVITFEHADQQRILDAARALAEGRLPADLPPRFAVGAARYAFDRKLARPADIARTVLHTLAHRRFEHRTRRLAA